MATSRASRSSRRPWPTAWRRRPSSRSCAAQRSRTSPSTGSPPSSARSDRLPSSARRSWSGRAITRRRSTPTRAANPWPWSSRHSPIPTSARSRCSKCCRGRYGPTPCSPIPRTHEDEKLHGLFTLRGKDQDPVNDVPAGDLAAVAKLGNVNTGDTLAPKGTPVIVPQPERAVQVLSIAIRPKSKGDEDKLMTALAPAPGGGSVAQRPPQRRDPPDPARRHGRDASGHRHRTPGPEVRRRGGDRGRHRSPTGRPSAPLPRRRASTRSRPEATASSASPSFGSSRSHEAPGSTSPTPSSEGRSPASSFPPCKRESRRRWRRPASSATPLSTSR